MISPFTVTTPDSISESASRREQTPALAMYRFNRIGPPEGPSGLGARGFELRPPGRPPGPDLVPGRKSFRPERDALERLFERPPERPEDAGFFMGQRYLKSAGK